MTYINWQAVATTPWWMFVLVSYLLWASYSAKKPRLISLKQLVIMPIVFMSLSLLAMGAMLTSLTNTHLLIWTGATTLGAGLGYLQMLFTDIKAVKDTHLIYVPGSWWVLILVTAGFIAKFCFHIEPPHVNPADMLNAAYSMPVIFLYGLLTGLFIGRLGYALRCIKSGPYTV